MRRVVILSSVAILMSGAAWAQQGSGPAVDATAAFTVRGAVVELVATAGAGHPTLSVDDASRGVVTVAMAPLWYLEENGFSASKGDQVEALVYPCTGCTVDGVGASVDNLSLGSSIQLRSAEGYPLWMGPRRGGPREGTVSRERTGGRGTGPLAARRAGQCSGPDVSQAQTVTGRVVTFSGGPGQGLPTLVLEAGGEQHEIVVAPYRAVMAAGLQLEAGRELGVTFAPAPPGHLVALSISDPATGAEVQLRDPETGLPLRGRGRGRGMGPGMGAGPGAGPGNGDCPYRR